MWTLAKGGPHDCQQVIIPWERSGPGFSIFSYINCMSVIVENDGNLLVVGGWGVCGLTLLSLLLLLLLLLLLQVQLFLSCESNGIIIEMKDLTIQQQLRYTLGTL